MRFLRGGVWVVATVVLFAVLSGCGCNDEAGVRPDGKPEASAGIVETEIVTVGLDAPADDALEREGTGLDVPEDEVVIEVSEEALRALRDETPLAAEVEEESVDQAAGGEEEEVVEEPEGGRLIEEDWLLVTVQGAPAGSGWHKTVEAETKRGGRFRSEMREQMSLRFGPTTISITTEGEIVERTDGTPESFVITEDNGQQKITTRGVFEGGQLDLKISRGGRIYERQVKVPEDIVMGHGEEMLVKGKGFTPGLEYSYSSYFPEVGVVNVTRRVLEPVLMKLPSSGRTARLYPVEIVGVMPGVVVTEYRTREGRMLLTRMPVMGMDIVLETMPKEEVAKRLGRPPDVSLPQLRWLTVDFPHPRPRDVTEAAFVISSTDGRPFEGLALEGGGMASRRLEDGSIEVTISYPAKNANSLRQPPEPPDKAALASGPYCQTDVAELRQKALDLAANSTRYLDTAAKAEQWVRGHMSFTAFGENFSSAERIWRERRGDCTEASVLLASLLRAAGIPTRLATGVAMLNGRMGFHMWVEVYGGRSDGRDTWIPFDSAVYSPGRADATHIRFGTVVDDAQVMEKMVGLIQLIGRLKVRGVRYRAGTVEVTPDSSWWERDGERLVHRGFLVSLPLPEGWDVKSVLPFGALKTVFPGGEVGIQCREVAYEDTFQSSLQKIRDGGFGIRGGPEYGTVKGRRWMRIGAAKGDTYLAALYVRDGNYLIRFTTEAEDGAVLRMIRMGLEFLSGDGGDAAE